MTLTTLRGPDPHYAGIARRRGAAGGWRGATAAAALLVTLAAPADTPDTASAPPGGCAAERDACLDLADRVARYCPGACASRHCHSGCLPPFAGEGRCLRCQENCGRLCAAQAERRMTMCADARARCRDETAE